MSRLRSRAFSTSLNAATKLFQDSPLEFMRRNSVTPPNTMEVIQNVVPVVGGINQLVVDAGMSPSQDITTDGTMSRFFRGGINVDKGDYKKAGVTVPRGWISFVPSDDPGKKGVLTFEVKRNPTPDRLPVWFLPWGSKKIVEMTIPRHDPRNSDDSSNDPNIFFTAALSGCSVFVRGDARNPTISHAGIDGGQTHYGADSAGFWRDLIAASMASDNDYRRVHEINRSDYIKEQGSDTTTNALAYKHWLKNIPGQEFAIEEVNPWGSVFGIRYGSLWSFYLQENAYVKRYKFVRERKSIPATQTVRSGIFRRKKHVEITLEENVQVKEYHDFHTPIRVRPFYPDGDGATHFRTTYRRHG